MPDIAANIDALKAQIRHTATKQAQDALPPRIVAVSKKQPAGAVRAAFAAGLVDFGENYVQEAVEKQAELSDLDGLTWHFIGPIQSNKTRTIATHFDWVHSVDRPKIAQRLSEQRGVDQGALNICLQVNIDNDKAKAGVSANQLVALAGQVVDLPQLDLRGLMILPSQSDDAAQTRASFREGYTLYKNLQSALGARAQNFDTLSMGMSGDFELAIEEGATLLRLGTAIFGPRDT